MSLAILMYANKLKLPAFEGFGAMDEAMAFGAIQDTYFHDIAPTDKGIIVNTNLNLTDLNSSLAQPELYLPKSPDRDYTTYFAPDPSEKYRDLNSLCQSAQAPNNMPARTNDLVGCGWYYFDDPSMPSIGLVGNKEGPLFLENLPRNGTWIWDLPLATQKEETKLCKRLNKCFLIDLQGFAGKCGFCMTKGYGVPIYPSGQEKYVDANGNFCGSPVVTSSSQCVQTTQPGVTTSSGLSCGNYGYPSTDNKQRMYTQTDCSALNGSYRPPGICTASDGTVFNQECNSLNMPAGMIAGSFLGGSTSVPLACSPNANGNLSKQCLIMIAKGIGFADTGSLIRLLSTNAQPNENEDIALKILAANNAPLPESILGSGSIDVISAGNALNAIYNAMSNSSIKVKASATLFVNGNSYFDPCSPEFLGNDTIPTYCLQQEFRKAGCQASGSAYPDSTTAGQINTLPITTISSMFQRLYESMSNTSDPREQSKSVTQCLGIRYTS